jgi:uncharacterized protein YndB with AHSA1/START domain
MKHEGRHSGHRQAVDFESRHAAPPEEVFRLLCPAREVEWIEGWSYAMAYSDSGVAEEDCVFTTDLEDHTVWVVTAYQPPSRIEFCIVSDTGVVARLKIRLEATPEGGSRISWRRIYTAVGASGADRIRALDPEDLRGKMEGLAARLEHFLVHGSRLTSGSFET